jgi:hypothetical protein
LATRELFRGLKNSFEEEYEAYKLLGQLGFVSVGQRPLDGEDDAVGNDGQEDGVLEGRPFDLGPIL